MTYEARYAVTDPLRSNLDRMGGVVVLEFGAPWCGHCQAAQPALRDALQAHPDITHIKIEDGKGKPLGRSFGVRLWPTVIVMEQGTEIARAVRPVGEQDLSPVTRALSAQAGIAPV